MTNSRRSDAMLKQSRTLLLGMAAVMMSHAASAADPVAEPSRSIADGGTWAIKKTTRLSRLTLGNGAAISPPEGYGLTLTVNGVGTSLGAGTYEGDVVLTLTKDIVVPFAKLDPYHFRTALYVDNGAYRPEQSVAAAVRTATVTDTSATDVSVTSKEENFNGIVVTGNSTYTVDNPTIRLTGNGSNDFVGVGAAIMASGNAKLTVNQARITTRGAVRTAVFVGGHSTVTVNDSFIEVQNGVLPANYEFSIVPGKMMEVPYGMGLSGNVRATNLIDTGTVYYNNSHIKAQGWGALSSDGDGPTRMYATNSVIETIDSGYGAYANGDSHDYFDHCTFNVADYGLIVGGNGSATFTNGTVVNSAKYGVMLHQGTGGGTVTIAKGTVFNTRSTAIQVKGRGTTIVVDAAELHPGNGVILQTMENDDPIIKAMMANAPPEDMPGGSSSGFSGDVVATFKNVTLDGDIFHAMTNVGELAVSIEKTTLTGAISLATAAPASGTPPSKATYRQVGDVTNTAQPVPGKHGLKLTLGSGSKWVVDKTSYLTQLNLADGAVIAAPQNFRVTLVVDGTSKPIEAGSYTGNIMLRVARKTG